MIEKKIKESGYPRPISGSDVYDDICDQIEGKENGSYVVLSKFDDDVIFEYHITVMDDEFNLGVLTMRTPEGVPEWSKASRKPTPSTTRYRGRISGETGFPGFSSALRTRPRATFSDPCRDQKNFLLTSP